MRSFRKFLITFLAITGAVALSTRYLDIQFGASNYWDHHGAFYLIILTAFPRIALILGGIPFSGLLGWFSWIFAPRILVAVLATINYWNQNPVLVIISWLIALGGESSEKYAVVRRSNWKMERNRKGFDSAKWVSTDL